MTRPGLVCLLTLALCLASASAAEARQNTDIVTLKNGDRLTCEIKQLRLGLLEISTDDLGTVFIEWDKVASVTTTRMVEIETVSGERYHNVLRTTSPSQLTVDDVRGPIQIDFINVVRLEPVEQKFWRRLQGSFGIGGSYAQSSGIGQFNANFTVGSRRRSFEWRARVDTTNTVQENEDDTSRHIAEVSYTHLLEDRWVVPAFGRYESNPELGYNLRSMLGGGIGRNIAQTNRTLFQLGGGLSVNRELPVTGEPTTNVEALGMVTYSFFTYDYPKTEVELNAKLFSSLTGKARFRATADVSLLRAIVSNDFYVAITLFDDYDSRPPSADTKTNDVGFTFSVRWKFP